ncbi:hypothetical protein DIS24_g9273 [Lasiodiplodia hormozganensis]|uniref:DUF6536 domain-containing protein n=1 Tax=Lasiodiplodia hormozganensis TaxID=869390 RepID=A0AA39XUL4_9PEZI|nr:hypothetical protein DIS24_g9273 [Lasiodiplodia hormozganensis]
MINFLSTVLLTASSYCMQITCAPSRSEIDAAHKDGTWLDIGILSLHNFSYISKRRRMILILLSFSSLPLHLCYNSAIFEVTKGHSYTIHYVSSSNISEIDRINNTMDRLENHEWMERYSTQYVSDSTDLYFIVDRVGFDMTLANETWEITSPTSWNPSQFGTLNFPANDSSFPMMSSIDGASHGLSDLGITFQWPEPVFINATVTTGLDKVFDFSAKDEDGFWNLHSGGRRAPTTPWPLRIHLILTTSTSAILIVSLQYMPQAPTWGTKSITILSFAPQSFDSKGILLNSVIPNIPHVLLSFTYFAINRICTSNHFVKEWNGYGTTRKGLRVSKPSGQQRKTYNLQLPYSWAIPLTATSGSLHWLASQSIFLTRLELYDENGDIILHGEDSTLLSKCTTGYSALSALVFALVVITLMLTIWWFARSKIQVDVPVSAHCSLAIAAACHPPPDEETPHLKPVQWGVARNEVRHGVKHCTFTSEPVTAPVPGELYA